MKIQSISNSIGIKNGNVQKTCLSFRGNLATQADKFVKSTPKAKNGFEKLIDTISSAWGSVTTGTKVSDSALDKLFAENNFRKDQHGRVFKKLTHSEARQIERIYGDTIAAQSVKDCYKPANKGIQNSFREFLEIGDNYAIAKKNFDSMYTGFSILYDKFPDYAQFSAFLKENPAYTQLIQNMALNSPKSKAVYEALDNYKGSGYLKINKALRDKTTTPTPEVQNQIKLISSFLDTQEIKTPIKLYRGDGYEVLNNIKLKDGSSVNLGAAMVKAGLSRDEKQINKIREYVLNHDITAHQPSFMSTSIDKSAVYDGFLSEVSNGKRNVLFELKTKPNTKGAFLEQLPGREFLAQEKEVLLQKGSDLRISDVKFENGYWTVVGEVAN